jgi:hypothetical protein
MKKKLKKYNSGTTYLQPEYNTTSVQKTGRGQNAASGIIDVGTGLMGTGGAAMTNSARQNNYNNPEQNVSTGKMVGGNALKGAAMGSQIGSVGGIYGKIIGAGVGAIAGSVSGLVQANKINNLAAQTRKNNAAQKKQLGYSAIENEQVGMAKNGITSVKVKKGKLSKYPGGSSSIATQKKQVDPTLPVFTSAENQQLKGLVGTPVYKEAVRTAINYKPTYVNPRPGSSQATFEQNAWNNAVGTFNKRDTLTAAPVDFSSFQAKQAQMAQSQMANYNSGNQKLDNHLMNQGAYTPIPGAMPNPLRRNTASYEKGTQGVSKYPGGTPEHKQAIHQLLGYTPKSYPVGSQGYVNQEKHFNAALEMINQGYRPAVSPSGHPGYEKKYEDINPAVLQAQLREKYKKNPKSFVVRESQYLKDAKKSASKPPSEEPSFFVKPNNGRKFEKGSKKIEVEGDEIQLAKKGNKFVVKNDFKNGPSHSEGGIVINAQEGDIITPAHKRGEVVEAINEGNNAKLERIRKTLPKDTNSKFAKGTKKVDKKDAEKASPKDFKPFASGYTPNSLRPIASVKTGNPSTSSNSSNIDVAGVAGTLGEIAPIAYNIGQGLFGKVQKTNRRNFNPTGMQYQDMSQPLRNEINSLYNQDKASIRNASGGNAGTYLSNVGAASASKFKRLQEVNNAEASRKIQTQNANTQLENNAQLTNLQLNNQYDEMDLANSARKDDFLAAGLGQASQFAQTKSLDRKMTKRDEEILKNLETSNYKIVDGKLVPKKKNGTSGIKLKHKMKKC